MKAVCTSVRSRFPAPPKHVVLVLLTVLLGRRNNMVASRLPSVSQIVASRSTMAAPKLPIAPVALLHVQSFDISSVFAPLNEVLRTANTHLRYHEGAFSPGC